MTAEAAPPATPGAATRPAERIAAFLAAQRRLVISTHVYPDGDAVGSQLALDSALRQLGVDTLMLNATRTSEVYHFLPGADRLRSLGELDGRDLDDWRGVPLVSLDCARADRLGRVPEALGGPRVVNIDHHVSNDHFGDPVWVDADACATGEQVLELIVALGVPLDLDIATCVYAAILSDTGCFCFSNTTPKTHEIAARLVDRGVDPAEVSRKLYRSRTLGQLRLFAQLVETVTTVPLAGGLLASATLTHAMCARAGIEMLDTADAVQVPISIAGVELGLLFRECEDPNQIKVSLRSEGLYDVSQLAARFGGGGHTRAAGCTLDGPIDAARDRVVNDLLDHLARR